MLLLLILLTVIVISFRTAYVQEKTGEIIGTQLSQYLKHKVVVKRVQIDWFDHIILNEISLYDNENSQMIHLGEGFIDFRIFTLEKSLTLRIEDIILKDGEVHLIRHKDSDILNINEFIDAVSSLGDTSQTSDTNQVSTPFKLDDVRLINMRFAYDDMHEGNIDGFDHNHFSFDSVYSLTKNLYVCADTFRIDIPDLTTVEGHTRIKVHKLAGTYTLCGKYMELEHMYAHIGNSLIRDYVRFSYNEITDMEYFNDKTFIKGNLDSSFIDFNDLSHFAPVLKKYPYRIAFSGKVAGTVSRFTASKMKIYAGNSALYGSIHMDGLPDFFTTYIDADLKKVHLDQTDIAPFFPEDIRETFQRIGYIDGPIRFNGFPENFIANSNLHTKLGNIITDTEFNIEENVKQDSYYSGRIITNSFNLGGLINNSQLGNINMNGTIEGVGLDIDNLCLKMLASIHSIEFNQYTYKNINTDAIIQKSLFNGHVDIKDSNLIMSVNGMFDYRESEKTLQVKVQCEKAQLKPLHLNLYGKNLLIKSNMFIDFKGTGIDDAVGNGYITDSYLLYDGNKEIYIDTLHLVSSIRNDSNRILQLTSTVLSGKIEGNFKPTIVAHDFIELVTETSNRFSEDSIALIRYYRDKKQQNETPYYVNYDIDIHDINAFLNIYTPGLYISGNSSISGKFTSGTTKSIKSSSYIDTLYYKGFEFRQNKFNLSSSQRSDHPDVTGTFSWTSRDQDYQRFTDTENLVLEANLSGTRASFNLSTQQKSSTNKTNMSGLIDLYEPYNILHLKHSFISIKDKIWTFEENRNIYFNASSVRLDSISVFNGNERLTIFGKADSLSTRGGILLNEISISDFTYLFTDYKFNGIINGIINLGESNVNSTIRISDFEADTIYIGNVNGQAVWNNAEQLMDVDLEIENKHMNVFNLSGYYIPGGRLKDEEIKLKASFKETDISSLNSVAEGIFTNISGFATGEINITGKISEPIVNGGAFIKNGSFKIPFMGTTYHFSDYIKLDNERIGFTNLELKDVNNMVCSLNGGLNHDHFTNFVLDVKGKIPEKSKKGFQALNLKDNEGSTFYGEAFVTGDWEILGSFSQIKIKANAKSQNDTKIFIPLSTYSEAVHQSYIQFVDPSRKTASLNEKKKVDLSGIEMEFNFEITPAAYTEIIFDKKAGDIIRGNGKGNMKMTIDTRGDFNMFGNYEITHGKYNFTMAGIINKEFTIDPGSTIQWHGDPYEGELNIATRYRIFTSLKPILSGDSTVLNSADAQRKYPVNVLMGLNGNLTNPEINLGINIESKYPGQFTGDVTSFESTVSANPSELNKQAFSLIVLRKLSPINSISSGSSESSSSSVSSTYANLSELLSNQLSNFLSQIDENLEVNVDLNTLDKNGLNTFNMRFAYTALDGRLRISRESGYHYSNTTNAATNIVGEWTVEYRLSPSGNLKAKVYNKINQSALITSNNSTATMSTGFSLQHTQSFNTLKEMFRKKTKEPKRKAPKQSGIIYLKDDLDEQ